MLFLALVTAAVFKLPESLLPISSDTGMFATYGRLLVSGARPYLAYWDVHPPLVFVYWWAITLLTGGDWPHTIALAHQADVVLSAAAAACVWWTARELGVRSGAAILAAIVTAAFANMSMFSQEGSNPTKLVLLPSTLAMCAYARGLTRPDHRVRWFVLAGALATVAMLAKQPAALLLAGLLAHATWHASRGHRVERRFAAARALLGGAGLVALATAGIFLALGGLGEFIGQALTYNLDRILLGYWHSAQGIKTPTFRLDRVVRESSGAALFALTFIGGLTVFGRPDRHSQRLALWWAIASLGAIVGFREFEQIVPSFALLGAIAVARLWTAASESGLGLGHPIAGRTAIALLVGTILALSSSFEVAQVRRVLYERSTSSPPAASETVAEYVNEVMPAGPVFVWGNGAQLYALSGRLPASRFVNAEAVRASAPRQQHSRALLIEDLKRARPVALVLAPHSDESDLRLTDFPALLAVIQSCYQLDPRGSAFDPHWTVYTRSPAAAASECDPDDGARP